MDPSEWTTTWPTLPGRYWFYGRRSGAATKGSLHTAEVHETRNGIIYSCEGAFIYPHEGAQGQWHPMQIPALPTMKGEG